MVWSSKPTWRVNWLARWTARKKAVDPTDARSNLTPRSACRQIARTRSQRRAHATGIVKSLCPNAGSSFRSSRSLGDSLAGLHALVGILLAGFVVPPAVRRYGAKPVVLSATAIAALIVLVYPLTPIFWAWFVLRAVQGLAVATLFTVSEAWVIQYADGAYRARIVAIYSSVLAISFGLGPTLIAAIGIEGYFPFAIGAAVPGTPSMRAWP